MSAEDGGGPADGRAPDPHLGMRFRVEMASVEVARFAEVAGFSEATGFEVQIETEEYREGGVNTHTHKLPTRVTYADLVLRRGVVDPQVLWDWIDRTTAAVDIPRQTDGERVRLPHLQRDVHVVSCDPAGTDVSRWAFEKAYPVRWEGPQFQADQGSVAVETLELAHQGVSRVEP